MTARAELLAKMAASDDVRLRARGVIGAWLAERTEIPDVIDAADELSKAMLDADLLTVIKADLNAHIENVAALGQAQKVWVVTGVEDDGTEAGYRYASGVFGSPERAHEQAEHGSDVQEFDVQ